MPGNGERKYRVGLMEQQEIDFSSANSLRNTPLKILLLDPVLTEADTHSKLDEACKKTQFPVALPAETDITAIDASFGWSDFDDKLISALHNLLD